ncbi:hypothetical protein QLX08_009214 [Tetragonisca angustula]|uniref:Uncharacterized protein n=1 Tax=Tetragonisca angustula TaxID=166442 RepID=A0AAW0ZGX2_9HYME
MLLRSKKELVGSECGYCGSLLSSSSWSSGILGTVCGVEGSALYVFITLGCASLDTDVSLQQILIQTFLGSNLVTIWKHPILCRVYKVIIPKERYPRFFKTSSAVSVADNKRRWYFRLAS